MSMNHHVRSYIHQHNLNFAPRPSHTGIDSLGLPQKRGHSIDFSLRPSFPRLSPAQENSIVEENTYPKHTEKKDTSSQPYVSNRVLSPAPKQSPISARFPFDQCTDATLKETKNLIDASLRHYVHNKSSIAFVGSLRSFAREARLTVSVTHPLRPESKSKSRLNVSPKTQRKVCAVSQPDSPLSKEAVSILAASSSKGGSRRVLLLSLNKCFHNYLACEASANACDGLLQDTANFLTNLFVQEFEASDTKSLCFDIIESVKRGDVQPLCLRLIDEVKEKHIELGFDNVQDLHYERIMMNANQLQTTYRTDNPELYMAFKNIWRLNPTEFLEYSLEMLLSLGSPSNDRPFSNMSLFHKLLNSMEEEAHSMNLIRFYYAYRRELHADKRQTGSIDEASALEALILSAAKMSEVLMMEEENKEEAPRVPRKVGVRFMLDENE